jgi:hypothetical protein
MPTETQHGLDLRLDPWEVEYGSELPLTGAAAARDDVDLGVEKPSAEWAAVRPRSGVRLPRRLCFVDGVRRVEARVVARRHGRVTHGAFGSYGVGAAVSEDGVASIEDERVERVLALDSGESLPGTFLVGPGLAYRPISTPASDPGAPLQRIQDEMRLAEERLARERAGDAEALVVTDGPLTFGDALRGAAVGYVKRLFELYVEPALLGVLAALPSGARSPIFALQAPARFARYSWFLRLAAPRPGDSDLAGLVRLEVASGIGVEAARRLADATALALPRFAPSRGRDPRSPQNLLPIGALEAHLRRAMGDARLIRRHVVERLTEAALA